MAESSFEAELARTGKLVYTNVGDSMMPLIREKRDLLILEPPQGRLHRLDIPLYKRESGQYVLHRVLKVRKTDYMLCGDNRWQRESGITDEHIIGVLKGLVRDGKTISVKDWRLRLYAHIWCDLFWVRACVLRVKYFRKGRWKR